MASRWDDALKNMDMDKYRHSVETNEKRMKNIRSILTPRRCVEIFYDECSTTIVGGHLAIVVFSSTQSLERYLEKVGKCELQDRPINVVKEKITKELIAQKYPMVKSVAACLDQENKSCVAIATFLPGMFGYKDSIDILSFTSFTSEALESVVIPDEETKITHPYPGVRSKVQEDPKIPCDFRL